MAARVRAPDLPIVHLERDVVPVQPFRMPGATRDGLQRRHRGALSRLLHPEDGWAIVHAWETGSGLRIHAVAERRDAAAAAIDRMRFGLGVDQDLSGFFEAFKRDALLGPLIRRRPWLRPRRQADPFVALAWAITEQLIEGTRALEIQRALIHRHGFRSACGTWRDAPDPAALAGLSPAQMEACGLAGRRSVSLLRAAREVASGRADLTAHEPSWMRLRRIPGIGAWTLESLALYGQGRDEYVPAGDLAYIKLIGRLQALGRRATEDEVREFFAPYAPYAGLAATHLVRAAVSGELARAGA